MLTHIFMCEKFSLVHRDSFARALGQLPKQLLWAISNARTQILKPIKINRLQSSRLAGIRFVFGTASVDFSERS
jgi:hypothetical protein